MRKKVKITLLVLMIAMFTILGTACNSKKATIQYRVYQKNSDGSIVMLNPADVSYTSNALAACDIKVGSLISIPEFSDDKLIVREITDEQITLESNKTVYLALIDMYDRVVSEEEWKSLSAQKEIVIKKDGNVICSPEWKSDICLEIYY